MQKVIEKVLYCKHCKKDTLHYRNKSRVNYLLHLILILITLGWWIPIFLLSLFSSIELYSPPWVCSVCGTKQKSKIKSAIEIIIILLIVYLIVFPETVLNLFKE